VVIPSVLFCETLSAITKKAHALFVYTTWKHAVLATLSTHSCDRKSTNKERIVPYILHPCHENSKHYHSRQLALPRRTVQEKLALIEAWTAHNGRISQRQYCFANSLLPGTFNKWLSNVDRLRTTAANKKNVQRSARYATDTAELEAHVIYCAQNSIQLTVIDLLAHTRDCRLLQHADNYLAR
jgi:hypothetical protein